MNKVEVYIADELIDLVPGQAVAMTYQLNDIADIKNQRANFSNVFKATRTKGNDRKLGFASDMNSTDKRPYRMLPARIIIDGEDIVQNGYAVIKETNKYYNILVYSGLIDLFAKLADLKLKDLDLSEFDHVFNTATIKDLVNSPDGIAYPLIDYGHLVFQNTLLSNYMRFAIYAKEIFERIISNAGFTLSGSFLQHANYSKLIVPFTNDKLTNKQSAIDGSVTAEVVNYPVVNRNVYTVIPMTVTKGNAAGCWGTNSYAVGAHNIRGKLTVEGSIADTFPGTQKVIVAITAGTKGFIAYEKYDIIGSSINFKLTVDTTDYVAGETFSLKVKHSQLDGVTVTAKLIFTQDSVVPLNGFIPVAENLPDMKQKDFIKAIAQLYGIVYDIDTETQEVRARFMDDIITNKTLSKNWSSKLDVGKEISHKYTLGLSQENYFKYSNGNDETTGDGEELAASGNVPATLGTSSIVVDNTTLDAAQDAVNLPFSATDEFQNAIVDTDQSLTIPTIKSYNYTLKTSDITALPPFYISPTQYGGLAAYNAGTIYSAGDKVKYASVAWEWQSSEIISGKTPGIHIDSGDTGTNYTGKPYWKIIPIDANFLLKQDIKVKPRILLARSVNISGTLILSEQGDTSAAISGPVLVPYFTGGLDFGTLLPAQYKVVNDSANDAHFIRAFFTLIPQDVKNIDHLVPVYVNLFANFFYISKIDKYQQGESTAVELVKI